MRSALQGQDVILIPFGATWKYLDNGSNQGTAWRAPAFNDATWASGPAELGYGDGDEASVVSYGPNPAAKYITTYFRNTFSLPSVNAYQGYYLRVKRDAGFVLFINGVEVMRQNFDQAAVGYTRLAYSSVSNSEEVQFQEMVLTPTPFVNGNNTIAVEMHLSSASNPDMSFDMELTGLDAVPAIFRGPYLHAATTSGITVCWKTDVPTGSRVRYGTAPGALSASVIDPAAVLQHEVQLTGLVPNTTYYYAIGTPASDLAGDDSSFFFRTHPPIASNAPLRIWAIGDHGFGYYYTRDVRDAYLDLVASSHKAEVWLMLGDDTNWHGRESEAQIGTFRNMFEGILRNTSLWPIPGNHDYYSGSNGNTNTGPYYDMFAPPRTGASGGLASNTEAYYSLDYGNVHIVCLDTYGVSRSPTGPMATWLAADLAQAQATSKWIIVTCHHPPYTHGSHSSDNPGDSGGIMFDVREDLIPIMEAHGVDLVLSGHSHTYERSTLIDGHYGVSSTFDPATMELDGSAGRADELGPYLKPGEITPHAGTVYVVCGVSGLVYTSGALDHPVMYYSTNDYPGSMVIDVVGNTLSARFLNDEGAIIDHFDIRKSFGPVRIALKGFLEGPFDAMTGLMRDDLRAAGLVPDTQPYTGLFDHVGESAAQTVAPAVLAITGNNAVVDWVFVELRDQSDPTRTVAAKAALIQRDGDVVDVDGASPVQFDLPADAYFVVLRHRNHLGAMTGSPVALSGDPTSVDLSLGTTSTYGSNARKMISGIMALWAGNALPDARIQYTGLENDRDPILQRIGGVIPTNTTAGYHMEDINANGVVQYTGLNNDREFILQNIGGVIPTNMLVEQLP